MIRYTYYKVVQSYVRCQSTSSVPHMTIPPRGTVRHLARPVSAYLTKRGIRYPKQARPVHALLLTARCCSSYRRPLARPHFTSSRYLGVLYTYCTTVSYHVCISTVGGLTFPKTFLQPITVYCAAPCWPFVDINLIVVFLLPSSHCLHWSLGSVVHRPTRRSAAPSLGKRSP